MHCSTMLALRLQGIFMLVLVLFAVGARSVRAQGSVTLQLDRGPVGTGITATGTGWPVAAEVQAFFNQTVVSVVPTTVSFNGSFTVDFCVPQLPPGVYPTFFTISGHAGMFSGPVFTITGDAPGNCQSAAGYTVLSTNGWQQIPLSVNQGDQFKISYLSGAWTVDHHNFPYVDPAGYPPEIDGQIFQGCKTDSSLPYAALLGKIGDGPVFWAGDAGTSAGRFTAESSGPLYLRINDNETCHADNDGQVTVIADVTVRRVVVTPGETWVSCKWAEGCTFAYDHNGTQELITSIEAAGAPGIDEAVQAQCLAYFTLLAVPWACPILGAELQILGLVAVDQLRINDQGSGVIIYLTYGRPPGILPQ